MGNGKVERPFNGEITCRSCANRNPQATPQKKAVLLRISKTALFRKWFT
jgi:hypothetical protein